MSAMHQGAVSACDVSETERNMATRNLSAFVAAFFFPIWGSAVTGVESFRDEIDCEICHSLNTRV